MTEAVVVDQRFKLGRLIRESDVARVYETKVRGSGETWIKLARGAEHAEAIRREARVAAALGNLAMKVREEGTSDGLPFLILEPSPGQRVDHWVKHCGGRAPSNEAMGLGDELCQALAGLHKQGFSIGALSVESIVVVPHGGICLVELEHLQPLTDETKKADIALVGRVLYEMLAGRAYAADAPPLTTLAAELPRPMTRTVDEAARGEFAALETLQKALRSSVPQWLGPIRRPTPSISPDVDAPLEFTEDVVIPRSSRLMFDPELVDSSRPEVVAAATAAATAPAAAAQPSPAPAPVASPPVAPEVPATPHDDGRSSTTAVATPVAAPAPVDVALPPAPVERPRQSVLVSIFLGAGAAFAAITVVLGVSAARKNANAKPVDAARATVTIPASASPVAMPFPTPVAKAAAPSASVTAPPSASVEPPVVAAPAASVASSASAAPSAPVAVPGVAANETRLRFEGDASPRRVLVDAYMIGTTTQREVRAKCGTHNLQIGGKGQPRKVDLPCGSELVLAIEPNGMWKTR